MTRQEYISEYPLRLIRIEGEEMEMSVVKIRKAVMKLKIGKASEPKGVHTESLKNGTHEFFQTMTYIINNQDIWVSHSVLVSDLKVLFRLLFSFTPTSLYLVLFSVISP